MSIATIRPSTVDGIKTLAKKIKRERSIPHMEALDLASRQAGYENFVHAKRKLAADVSRLLGAGGRSYPVYLVAHWQERPDQPGARRRFGREHFRVDLTRPLLDVIPRHRLTLARNLEGMKVEYSDHLEWVTDIQGQAEARRALAKAARTLQFMDATGLVPPSNQRERAPFRVLEDLPHRDHTSRWIHPETSEWLLLDEPYHGMEEPGRFAWLESHGLSQLRTAWDGLYFPEMAKAHFIGPSMDFLRRIDLIAAKAATADEPAHWPEETGRNNEPFRSPARVADGKPARARPGASYGTRMGAIPYSGGQGFKSRWRPTRQLPLEHHRELGYLLAVARRAPISWRMRDRLDRARSELERWLYNEHPTFDQGAEPDEVYFGAVHLGRSKEPAHAEAFELARKIVDSGYNECKPKRDLLATLDAAAAELEKVQARAA